MTITSPPAVRRGWRLVRTVVLAGLVAPAVAWAVIRLFGLERGWMVQLVSFTPYAAAAAWVPAAIALAARRRLIAAIGAVAALALAGCVLPRAFPDRDKGPADGLPITVMTINMYVGQADPGAIVRLVRRDDVSILAVQEFTTPARDGLAEAGLGTLLPYQALADDPAHGTTGSGLYSRFPMTGPGSERGVGGNLQAYATIRPPHARALAVTSAHPLAPYAGLALPLWRADLAAEPTPGRQTPLRLLLGDFNSTLDHAPMRALIRRGYRDAADATGAGLVPTWGTGVPPITLDHVLVDKRIGVRKVTVHRIARSDHRAVVAELTVPMS
ncbi:endonuclease/exonuclease/phosphatase family protein [Actinoplanes sp. KI2]|uniref:endonuclease/exonuclease/phosphatase family protein n=1 Tax=Actinoplanes sp. KI2 TaxID=2983315 RepID=UPI0021D5A456|nr:endonuclease/exonuclease/phosphatase family protein [Actinoplanes sp. KI2]MCU7723618.1 endonuclease/exonuclease/phosphatase family protein [Actinoplanes sp. KI2]